MKPLKLRPTNNRARLICRVSSEKQRENYSIPQQQRRGDEYAGQKMFRITAVRKIVESASKPGRKQWEETLEEARNGPETHILIPKVDRSLRNAEDLAVIVNFPKRHPDKVLHFFDDNIVYDKDSPSTVVFMLMIAGAQATWEAARIAERTKAGMDEKARQGGWPNRPPFGYRNIIDANAAEQRHAKRLVVVPEQAGWVRRIYELAATGQHSLETIAQTIRSEGHKLLSRSQVAYIIRNALYAGFVEWPKNSGNLIKGRHEPVVSWELRKQAIAGLERHNKPQYGSREYRFKGLIRCARCNCAIVGDAKKKMTKQGERTYNYYRCGKNSPHRKCDAPKGYVNEEVIESQVLEMLERIQLTPELVTKTMEYLETAAQFDATENVSRLAQLRAEHKQILNRKENLLDLLADKKIDEAAWTQKRARYDAQLMDLEAHIKHLGETEPASYMAVARRTLELTNASKSLYISMSDSKRRELLASLHSNLTLDHKKLMPAWRKPYASFAKLASCPNWLPSSYPGQSQSRTKKSLILWHNVPCGVVLERHGRQKIVDKTTFLAHRSVLDKETRQPSPPRVQVHLKQALGFKARLAADPDLTQVALARQIGINPVQLTRLLRLTDLAPEIQRHIMAMPPCLGWGSITERALRPITLCRDREDQVRLFNTLLKAKGISNETIAA